MSKWLSNSASGKGRGRGKTPQLLSGQGLRWDPDYCSPIPEAEHHKLLSAAHHSPGTEGAVTRALVIWDLSRDAQTDRASLWRTALTGHCDKGLPAWRQNDCTSLIQKSTQLILLSLSAGGIPQAQPGLGAPRRLRPVFPGGYRQQSSFGTKVGTGSHQAQ